MMRQPTETAVRLPEVGELFAGQYRITGLLGSGGMGSVFAVTDESTSVECALKVLSGPNAQRDINVQRFFREARSSMRIKSAHVVRVFDVGSYNGEIPFMVMERLRGMDMSKYAQKNPNIPVSLIARWGCQACHALAHAHALGIVHRDIKLSNLFLDQSAGEPGDVRLLDFGISKVASREEWEQTGTLTQDSALVGSPQFISPEQLRDPRGVDARADVWSLGIVLYKLLTGTIPFDGESLGALFVAILERDIPPILAVGPHTRELEAVIRQCLRKNRDDRYKNVAEVAHDLALIEPKMANLSRGVAQALNVPQGAPTIAFYSQATPPPPSMSSISVSSMRNLPTLTHVPTVTPTAAPSVSSIFDAPSPQSLSEWSTAATVPTRIPTGKPLLLAAIGAVLVATMGVAAFGIWWAGRDKTTVAAMPSASMSVKNTPPLSATLPTSAPTAVANGASNGATAKAPEDGLVYVKFTADKPIEKLTTSPRAKKLSIEGKVANAGFEKVSGTIKVEADLEGGLKATGEVTEKGSLEVRLVTQKRFVGSGTKGPGLHDGNPYGDEPSPPKR
jgi:eukaryotic-like serine/threonine-protein kinase